MLGILTSDEYDLREYFASARSRPHTEADRQTDRQTDKHCVLQDAVETVYEVNDCQTLACKMSVCSGRLASGSTTATS